MGQARPSLQTTICGACGSGAKPVVLLCGLIHSCGFITSHELQQSQYLMVIFFPLAGRKHKLLADGERVDGGSPQGSCLEGSWLAYWWEKGKPVLLHGEETSLFGHSALRRSKPGWKSPSFTGTHIISVGSGEDDMGCLWVPKPACTPLWSTVVLHHRFHHLIKLAINNTVFLMQLRAESAVAWELTHSDSQSLSWEHRVIQVNLSSSHAQRLQADQGHPLSTLCHLQSQLVLRQGKAPSEGWDEAVDEGAWSVPPVFLVPHQSSSSPSGVPGAPLQWEHSGCPGSGRLTQGLRSP